MRDFELSDFLPYLLNQAAEATSRRFQRFYNERYGLLRTDWRVLFHLGCYGQMTAVEITQRAMLHRTRVRRAASRLIDMRLVEEERSDTDRRRKTLHLTTRGQTVFEELRAAAARYDDTISQSLDPKSAEVLRSSLKQLGGITDQPDQV